MSYKTELHCHTAGVSACGHITPAELAEKYIAAGYTTVVLTNHINASTFSSENYHGKWDWADKMDFFLAGYHALQEAAGDRLHILLGAEFRLSKHTATDYLVYGLTEEFLYTHPGILTTGFTAFSQRVRAAGMFVVQAHPFRKHIVVTNPKLLDAIEVYNGAKRHHSHNDIADIWADRFQMRKTSGSDTHRSDDDACAGIRTKTPITTNEELLEVLHSGNYTLIKEADEREED